MDALIIGESAAAHALAWKLAESRRTGELYCTSPYSGIDTLCTRIGVSSDEWIKDHAPDLVVGEEETLFAASSDCPKNAVSVTVDCFSDGHTIVPMPAVRVYRDGMGQPAAAEAPAAAYTDEIAHYAYHQFYVPYIRNLGFSQRGISGIVRFEMALADEKKPILRRVCRGMGDLDAAALLPLLRGELAKLLFACRDGGLTREMVRLNENCTAVVMAGAGEEPERIEGLADIPSEIGVFFGSIRFREGRPYTAGARPLFLCARCPDLSDARTAALHAAGKIRFPGCRRGVFEDQ